MAHVGDVDHHLDQMLHRAATLLYELLDILHDLVGLLGWVVAANISGRIEVLWALATEIDGSAPACDNRLTQIVVSSFCSGYVSFVLNLRIRAWAI
jgi:hypothetical protein